MVLTSVREVGLPWRTAELRSLAEMDWPQAALAWRAMAVFAQLCEEVAGLSHAVDEWHQQRRPRQLDCRIGETFLKWMPKRQIADELRSWAGPRSIQRLIRYPTRADLSPHVDGDDVRNILRVCRSSRRGATAAFGQLSSLAEDDVWRTFIRWKHRLTATSPNKVPVWLPHQSSEGQTAIDSALVDGFGVIDWPPGRSTVPYLILWPAEKQDIAAFLQASANAVALIRFLVDSTLRFGLTSVPVLPWFLELGAELSAEEEASIARLEASNYRLHLITSVSSR
jgi:hypothetical protein